jgi:predicted deacylase
MVNIDGVIYGNTRCDINGTDPNRKWIKNPNAFLHPLLCAIRKIVNNLIFDGYEIDYFLDLHAHSKKFGTFIYGCKGFDEIENHQFAWIMSKVLDKFLF